jgi:hypothetical protein
VFPRLVPVDGRAAPACHAPRRGIPAPRSASAGSRAIAPDRLEFDEDASVGPEAHAVLGERRAEEIAAELFEADAIVGGTQTLAWRSERKRFQRASGVGTEAAVKLRQLRAEKQVLDQGENPVGDVLVAWHAASECGVAKDPRVENVTTS